MIASSKAWRSACSNSSATSNTSRSNNGEKAVFIYEDILDRVRQKLRDTGDLGLTEGDTFDKAFGQAIGQFQAIQFKLADMLTELEAGRLMLYAAAAKLDAKAPDATQACAMAKRFTTDAGFRIANEALQIHGGYGYLAEYGVEKIVRDLRVHQILEGTNEIMRVIIARSMAA